MITFSVPHIRPVPQGSKRRGRNGQMFDQAGTRLKNYRYAITLAARQAMQGPLTGPVSVTIVYWLPIPKTRKDAIGGEPAYPCKRGDIDKLNRACLDGLTGSAFQDDSQVTRLHSAVRWCYEGETDPETVFAITGEGMNA